MSGRVPLAAGGQGRTPRDLHFGARVVALCAAGALAVVLGRAMGAL